MLRKLAIVCLINFAIAALMGLALRFSFIESIGINYRFLTHAHSHVAMLGWVYLMLYTFIIEFFIPIKKPIYYQLFWVTEIAVIGMMLSFPIQGYAAISIAFSTLHILCSYLFAYLIWKNMVIQNLTVTYTLKASLIFMMLSTIGVWCLGPAVGLLGKSSAFYQIAIQFFLHFQFNGWFLFAILAIFFYLIDLDYTKYFKQSFYLFTLATIITFALPIFWFVSNIKLLWLQSFGVLIQVFVLVFFIKCLKPKLPKKNKPYLLMLVFAGFCFILKILLQLFTISNTFSKIVFTNTNFIIGFIHLLMLGCVTGFLFAFLLQSKLVTYNKSLLIGLYSFILGFVLTEILLLVQGVLLYFGNGICNNYHLLLFFFSTLLFIGICFLLIHIITNKHHATKTFKTP